jgi:hypothetical protein
MQRQKPETALPTDENQAMSKSTHFDPRRVPSRKA